MTIVYTASTNFFIDKIINHFIDHRGENLVFVTITLKPKFYKYQTITQYEMTYHNMLNNLHCINKYAEVVEVTNNSNLHYHCILLFKDKYNRITFINNLRKSRDIGYYKITDNPITAVDQLIRSAIYLVKDIDVTAKCLHTHNYKPDILTIK